MKRIVWSMGLAALLALGSAALGDVQYISESRSVEASGTVWPVMSDMQSQNDLQQSADAGAFIQTALVNLTVSESIPGYAGAMVPNWLTSYAAASQKSSFTETGITESGSLDYYTTQTYAGNGAASAESSLSVTFSVDSDCDYSLFCLGLPGQTATLTNLATGQIWDGSVNPLEGILTPGEYTLTHDVDYGQAYHDTSTPVGFALDMSFSQIIPVPEPSVAMWMATGMMLLSLRACRFSGKQARR